MNKQAVLFTLALITSLVTSNAHALPSFSGKYGGFTRDKVTSLQGTLTAQNRFKNIEIGALSAACSVTIPGESTQSFVRDTSISKSETPIIRLRSNGTFNDTFDLIDEGRVDFRDASVILQGKIKGGKGTVNVTISFAKNYEDGSSETCSGTATVYLKRAAR